MRPSLVSFLALCALLSSCDAPDVVAKVGRTRLTVSDVESFKASRGFGASTPSAEVLDAVVRRQLLAEGARKKGLEDRPELKARLLAVKREVLAQALVDDALQSITPADVKARYEATKASLSTRQAKAAHIFVAVAPPQNAKAVADAQSKASAAWGRLLGGDDFAQVAKELSDDAPTAARGGELGVLKESEVPKELFQTIASLEPGTFSKPVMALGGLHVFKLLSPVETVTPTFDEVKGRLLAELQREAEGALLKSLEKDVAVERHPERLPGKASEGAR